MCCSYTKILYDSPKKTLRKSKEESKKKSEYTLISKSLTGKGVVKRSTFLGILKKIITMLS